MRLEDYLVSLGLKNKIDKNKFQINYDLACKLNRNKPYIKRQIANFDKPTKSPLDNVINGRKIEIGGCFIDAIDGTITKQFTDFNIICLAENLVIERHYNSNNPVVSLQGKKTKGVGLFGYGWVFAFETYVRYAGVTFKICYIDGSVEEFSKKADKWENKSNRSLTKITEEDFRKSEISVEKEGLIYTFSFDGRLKFISDKSQNSFEIIYMGNTYLIDEIMTSCGRKLKFSYKDNKISMIRDNINRSVKYYYEDNYLTSVEQSNAGKYKFSYDEKHKKLCQIIDPNGNIEFKAEFDRIGKPIYLHETMESGWKLKYDERLKELHFVSEHEAETIIYKHDRSNLVKEIRYNNDCRKFEYDPYGNVTLTTSERALKIEYAYNQYNQLISKISNEDTVLYSYTDNGKISKIIYSNGYEKMFFYNRDENLTEIKKVTYKNFVSSTSYDYDAKGRIIEKIDGNKNITKMFYKENDSVMPDKIIHPNGFIVENKYDGVGRLISETQNEKTTEYKYNNLDLIIQTKLPDGDHDFKLYDLLGNLKEMVLPKEVRISEETNTTPRKFSYKYDDNYLLEKIVTPMGEYIDFSQVSATNEIEESEKTISDIPKPIEVVDYVGRLLEKRTHIMKNEDEEILYRFEKYYYDKNFNLIEKKVGCEYVLVEELPISYALYSYIHDDRNNLTNIHKGTGGNISSYYKEINLIGKETCRINENKNYVTTFEYNQNGLLSKKLEHLNFEDANLENIGMDISNISEIKIETSFEYDENGNLTKITLPDGTSISYQYDDNGRPVADLLSRLNLSYQLEDFQQNTQIDIIADDLQPENICYEKDLADRILNILDKITNEVVVSNKYDVNDNIVEMCDKNGITTFLYDKYGRILKTIYPEGEFDVLEYDFADNITSFTDRKGNTTKYIYNSLNKIGTIIFPNISKEEYLYGLDGLVSKVIKSKVT